jgi:L-fucose isomerase-like protein
VAKVYMGTPKAHWPTPLMDIKEEVRRYEAEFARMKGDLADVEFVTSELVTSPAEAAALKDRLATADGILAIHLSMGVVPILRELLSAGRPTALFAAPYSGHEWTGFGAIRKQKEGALLECFLTSDFDQLAVAIRPFRAIHHLREARILDVTTRNFDAYAAAVKQKFGTEIVKIGRDRVLDAYKAIPDADAEAETRRWIGGAEKIVEPSRDEIFRSCKLALALQNVLDEEQATMVTVDCYGSMWRQLPAYPCISHARMNNMGLGGVCESDLPSAMTQALLQGLSGRPGFVSDPTMDVSARGIVLAHCMGTPRMDGPDKPPAPYRLRCVMERQEGAVPQVFMRVGRKVTQAELIGTDQLIYFTGEIIEAPDLPRGCRTKIKVRVDGDPEKLWQNWSHGLHRVTCYGNLTADLARFCRYKEIQMVNEA